MSGQVRSAGLRDLAAISRLAAISATTDYGFYPTTVQQIIRARNSHWRLLLTKLRRQRSLFVAEVDGRVVGFLVATPNNDDVALVYSLYIDPNYRGQAYARRLLKLFEENCVQPPVTKIMLWTEIAGDYYLKLGWREVAVLPDHWWGQTFRILVKDVLTESEHATITVSKESKK